MILDRTIRRQWLGARQAPPQGGSPPTGPGERGHPIARREAGGNTAPPRRGFGRFLAASTLLHVLGLGALILFLTLDLRRSPPRERTAALQVVRIEEEESFAVEEEPPPEPAPPEDPDVVIDELEPLERAVPLFEAVIEEPVLEDPVFDELPLEYHPEALGAYRLAPPPPPPPVAIATPPPPPPVPPVAEAPPAAVEPILLEAPAPRYPLLARRRGWQGTVLCRITVGTEGAVLDVAVESSSGYRVLDEAALEALRRWRFVPGLRGGERGVFDVLHQVTFEFEGS